MQIRTLASGSSGNCYMISDGSTQILIEAGIQFKKVQELLEFKTRRIKAVFVTHEHGDHAKYVSQFLSAGLDVYMTLGTALALDIKHHRLKIIHYNKQTTINTLKVTPFETQHDVAEPCGFVIKSEKKKLIFATDTYYIKYKFKDITHLMLEVNHDYDIMMKNVEEGILHASLAHRIMRSHLNLENAIKWLRAQDLSLLEELHMIHLSKDNSKAVEFKDKIQRQTGVHVIIASNDET